MSNSNEENSDKDSELLEKIDDNLSKLLTIFEKFGLDIITKIGQTNTQINMLTDKIKTLSKATIDVKGLSPQLNKVIESQKILESEFDLVKSLIQQSKTSLVQDKADSEAIGRDETITINQSFIIKQFEKLANNIDKFDDPVAIKEELEAIKETLFELTGGHKILYEISQVSNKLSSDTFDETVKRYIKEKIGFWINKL